MSAAEVLKAARAAGVVAMLDGPSLALKAEREPPPQMVDLLRAHKPQILELLRAERRAIIQYLNAHFRPSPLGRCAHCGWGVSFERNPFVTVFVGEDRADVHASCHPAWLAEREAEACVALGLETRVSPEFERNAASSASMAQ
jgi:hypothetical protein